MLKDFQNIIQYEFKNADILVQALTHPSQKKQYGGRDYERLEFLGDSVLGFIVADILYSKFIDEKEGSLAKRRAAIVCKNSLAQVARDISLDKFIQLGKGEEQSGGRENEANLENSLEALIAAIYLDGGVEEAKKFVRSAFNEYIFAMKTPPKDSKSELQEWAQSKNLGLPKYEVENITGPAHDPEILVSVEISEYKVSAKAKSRRSAEKKAASKILNEIGE